jgi:bacteriorhodopsin
MPFVPAEQLAALVDWLYRFLLYGLGAIAIVFVIGLLVEQEIVRAYRGASHQDPAINTAIIIPLLIAFFVLAMVHVLRILGLL